MRITTVFRRLLAVTQLIVEDVRLDPGLGGQGVGVLAVAPGAGGGDGLVAVLQVEGPVRAVPEAEPALEPSLVQEVGPGEDVAVDVRLEPMVGRGTEDGDLLLYRTVLIDDQAYRQGLVLDPDVLVASLARPILDRTGLGGAARIGLTEQSVSDGYLYQHRFGEPFGDLVCTMALDRLSSLDGSSYVYGLSVALILATLLGHHALL